LGFPKARLSSRRALNEDRRLPTNGGADQIAPNNLSKKFFSVAGGPLAAPPAYGIGAGGTGGFAVAGETPRLAAAFENASPPLLMVIGAPTAVGAGGTTATGAGISGLRQSPPSGRPATGTP
jgi:hypothetical protein